MKFFKKQSPAKKFFSDAHSGIPMDPMMVCKGVAYISRCTEIFLRNMALSWSTLTIPNARA